MFKHDRADTGIVAIIQARTRSTRLPGKVLLELEGESVLSHVIRRVKASKLITNVLVATTIKKEDLAIVRVCSDMDTRVFCGSEEDVLDRYYQAARLLDAVHIVRITADCPLMDPAVIDDIVTLHLREKADYTSNTSEESYPDGLDVEIFRFAILKNAWENACLSSEREHVTPHIKKQPCIFKTVNLKCAADFSKKRWTLDNPEDYEFVKLVYEACYPKNPLFGMKEVLEFLEENPAVEEINRHIRRNEGYAKSLEAERTPVRDFLKEGYEKR